MDTATTAHEASSSSSSKSKLWNYDLFLSFRGEDARNGFTGHLHAALKDRGYQAYMDEDDLKRGEEIKEELFRAIEGSRISIVVFSKRYADSSWCLDELVKIMECRSKLGRHVLPIFYHVDPSHVRKQDGDLAEAFLKHEEVIGEETDGKKREAKQERVKQWRKALTEAANLSGHHLHITDNGREANLIREIVDNIITKWLMSTNKLRVAKHPVGINSRIQDIISHLSSDRSNVVMVGIWGMGGLGKTTAAKAIYNQIHHKFQFKSFLHDISNTASKHGLVYLQEKLISDILKTKSEISSVDEGIGLIEDQFRHRRVLVIMDNIDEVGQLDAIAGNHDWFGPGSRIILTTRDEHLLKLVDKTYPAQKLNEREALWLFSWHALGNNWPNEEYLELSKEVVSYCGGLPLALEVLGSFLFKRPIAEWKSQLEKLKRTPEGKIIESLRISFEGLDDAQKAIFIDISCFFIGWKKDFVAKVLEGCGFYATIGISVLRERCLVTVEQNELNMHDLLREMAKVIIYEKSPGDPGKWSRLWDKREVINVLTNKSGTEEVEGLALPWGYTHDTAFSTEAFANMKKLRLLQLYSVELNGEYKHLPKELIWLSWKYCPLQSIPDDFFNQDKLVVLEMQWSNLFQVWEGSKSLRNLKTLDLSSSWYLEKSPDFSQVPNLEELILESCWNLFKIHPSIGRLKRLSLVNLQECHKLISLPGDFYKSKSVETLLLNGCSKFRKVHEDIGEMISLRTLEAHYIGIREVPPSIVRLKNLTRLSLSYMASIHLPHSLHGLNSLRELDISTCALADDEIPKDLGSLISLQVLDLSRNHFHTLHILSGLSKLETLRLRDCRQLRTITDLPTNLKFLLANGCPALETMPNFSEMSNIRELNVSDSLVVIEVPGLDKSLNSMTCINMKKCTNLSTHLRKNILQGWTSCGFGGIFLHGNYVPDWFEFVNEGTKVTFDIPPSDGRNFEGLTLFCLYHSYGSNHLAIIVINNTQRTELRAYIGGQESHDGLYEADDLYEDDYLLQGQLSNSKLNLHGGDKVDILFENPAVSITRTGVNLVWDKPMKENMHDFHTLPILSGLSKLETLRLRHCDKLRTITDLPTNLKILLANGCPALETMPNFSEMSNIRELKVSDSPKVIEVPGLDKSLNSMTWINMKKCTNLSTHLRKNILQGWTSCGFGGIFFHRNYVPDWFEFVDEGTKVTFDIPPSDGHNLEGLTLFCLYHSNRSNQLAIIVINNTQRTELRAYIGRQESHDDLYEDDYLLQGQLSNSKLNLQGGDKVDILFENPAISITRTGVNLAWDKPMKENMHDLDKAGYVFDTHPTRFYDEGGPSHEASDNNRPRKQMRITIDD